MEECDFSSYVIGVKIEERDFISHVLGLIMKECDFNSHVLGRGGRRFKKSGVASMAFQTYNNNMHSEIGPDRLVYV